MNKQNLVFIHSFPTNSILLKGLIDYLSDYFKIYIIDLPGFVPNIKPLEKVSLKNYAIYVKERIKGFHLDEYWLGGVSFGFLVANEAATDCKGILAIEPYLNSEDLKLSFFNRLILLMKINFICSFNLSQKLWASKYFKKMMMSQNLPENIIDTTLNTLDAKTFFYTARYIFSRRKKIQFKDLPYILVINQHDEIISAQKTIEQFEKGAKKLLLVNTTSAHYPKDISKEYFKKHIALQEIKRMLKFMKSN
jgi:hypothetical protein